jgi:hypothetical protein
LDDEDIDDDDRDSSYGLGQRWGKEKEKKKEKPKTKSREEQINILTNSDGWRFRSRSRIADSDDDTSQRMRELADRLGIDYYTGKPITYVSYDTAQAENAGASDSAAASVAAPSASPRAWADGYGPHDPAASGAWALGTALVRSADPWATAPSWVLEAALDALQRNHQNYSIGSCVQPDQADFADAAVEAARADRDEFGWWNGRSVPWSLAAVVPIEGEDGKHKDTEDKADVLESHCLRLFFSQEIDQDRAAAAACAPPQEPERADVTLASPIAESELNALVSVYVGVQKREDLK